MCRKWAASGATALPATAAIDARLTPRTAHPTSVRTAAHAKTWRIRSLASVRPASLVTRARRQQISVMWNLVSMAALVPRLRHSAVFVPVLWALKERTALLI